MSRLRDKERSVGVLGASASSLLNLGELDILEVAGTCGRDRGG